MKKLTSRVKKLTISREVVVRLESEDLSRAGGQLQGPGRMWTGCLSDCTECGGAF